MQFARFNGCEEGIFALLSDRVSAVKLSYYNLTKGGTFSAAMFVVSVRRNIFQEIGLMRARFPDDVVRVKRSVVRMFDGARSKGRLLQRTKSWFRRLV